MHVHDDVLFYLNCGRSSLISILPAMHVRSRNARNHRRATVFNFQRRCVGVWRRLNRLEDLLWLPSGMPPVRNLSLFGNPSALLDTPPALPWSRSGSALVRSRLPGTSGQDPWSRHRFRRRFRRLVRRLPMRWKLCARNMLGRNTTMRGLTHDSRMSETAGDQ